MPLQFHEILLKYSLKVLLISVWIYVILHLIMKTYFVKTQVHESKNVPSEAISDHLKPLWFVGSLLYVKWFLRNGILWFLWTRLKILSVLGSLQLNLFLGDYLPTQKPICLLGTQARGGGMSKNLGGPPLSIFVAVLFSMPAKSWGGGETWPS